MKKKVLLLLAGACMTLAPAIAATVPVATARTVAANFYQGAVPAATGVSPTLLYTRTEADGTADFYVFDMAPQRGFVIVSADDVARPVIGYSTESNFDMHFDKTGLSDWMSNTATHLRAAVTQHIAANTAIRNEWIAVKAGPYQASSRVAAVGPLMRTHWDQAPNYNALCPMNTTANERAVTGCVATTMAQIMKYWSYPVVGVGSYTYTPYQSGNGFAYPSQTASFNHVYNWANMPNVVNSTNYTDVAQLMYDCGVSVAMGYDIGSQGGSGAYVQESEVWGNMPCAESSFKNHFLYDPTTLRGVNLTSYTVDQWFQMMKAEIQAGRVVQYEGADPTEGGHTWVMDGYDANNLMHMNWGWSGSYDGYFATTNLTAGGANFITREGALIGIQPMYPYHLSAQAGAAQICAGTSTTLTASGPAGATYSWYPTTGVACPTCATTTFTPAATGVYILNADSAGVHAQTSVYIEVVPAVTASFSVPATQACTEPATFNFANRSAYGSNYFWDFGDGTTSSDSAPAHTYTTYGVYDVTLITSGNCGADTSTQYQYIALLNTAPVVADQSVCSGSAANFTGYASGDISWYNTATGGTPVATGGTFSTPAVTATTTWYAEAQVLGPMLSAGLATNTIGTGSYYNNPTTQGINFNCTLPQRLTYVDVYAQSDGMITIGLGNSTGGTITSKQVQLYAGYNTVDLGFNLPVANNLQLYAVGANNTPLYRTNTGVVYPYFSTDSTVKISSSTNSGKYNFFYNWVLQSTQCTSARIPVTAYVIGQGGNSFSYTSAAANVVHFAASASGSGLTYSWNFGDGTTSTDQNPVHAYSNTGNYVVTLNVSNGACSDQVSGTISSVQGSTGIQEIAVVESMTAQPNPVHDQLQLHVTAAQAADMQLTVYDMIGNVVAETPVRVNIGGNAYTQDVAGLASGVYTIALHNNSSRATSRFVKQ